MAAKREKRKEKRRKKKEEQRRKLEEIEAKNKENFELQAAQEKEKLKVEGIVFQLNMQIETAVGIMCLAAPSPKFYGRLREKDHVQGLVGCRVSSRPSHTTW